MEDTKNRLAKMTENEAKYKTFLQLLVTQGLCRMLEKNVTLVCRKVDKGLVEKVLPDAIKKYKEISKKDCQVNISSSFLPAER